MKKSQLMLLSSGGCVLALMVIAAVAGPGLYLHFAFPAASEEATLMTAEDRPSEHDWRPLDADELAGAWLANLGSEAGYRADSAQGDIAGTAERTDLVRGSFAFDGDGLTLSAAEFTVDLSEFEPPAAADSGALSARSARPTGVPEARFELAEPVRFESLTDEDGAAAEARGSLTIAGVTRAVTAQIEVRSDGAWTELTGTIPVLLSDFDLDPDGSGLAGKTGTIEFTLTGARE